MGKDTERKEQVIALAALLQSCYLVDKLSKTGDMPKEFFFPLINSLFEFDPDTTRAVFGGIGNLRPGLTVLAELLDGHSKTEHSDALRYAIGVLHLEKKLYVNADMLAIVRSRLEHLSFRSTHFSSNIEDTATAVAAIYQDTLSTYKYRIQVTGQAKFLQDRIIADKIRALLFAAVRAGILWQQLGGNRWILLLRRKSFLKATNELLHEH